MEKNMEEREAFGAALKQARETADMTQNDVSNALEPRWRGHHQTVISAWETAAVNVSQPGPREVFMLERVLGCGPGVLSAHLGFVPVGHQWTVGAALALDDRLTVAQRGLMSGLLREFTGD